MKVIAPALPNGRVIFCDDIRQEMGGKSSLMGIYRGAMYFPKEVQFPASLPRLSIAVFWHEPAEGFANEIAFKTFFVPLNAEPDGPDGELIAETHCDLKAMSKVAEANKEPPPRSNQIRSLTSLMTVAPLLIPHPGKLRVRAFRDDQVIMVGALRIEHEPS